MNVDITEDSPTVLSLCSGYGGIELGVERVLGSLRVLAHVEIEAFAIANLVNKMETGRMVPTPIWTNLKTLPLEPFRGRVDILMGGYPCQPFSAAGKRGGKDDPRHLFPYIVDIIREIRPRLCFFENVEGHISLGLREVIEELEGLGYRTTWGIFSAAEVGAPHQRKRVFILAHRDSRGGEVQTTGRQPSEPVLGSPCENRQTRWPSRPGEPQYEWEEPRVVADSEGEGLVRRDGPQTDADEILGGGGGENALQRSQTQPQLGRTPDGTRDRVDRLRLLGNGVVPQTAEKAFRTLMRRIL